ncbi:MCE family protein [Skermania sp. ID1734]|uniref:MCE family protein n=1 Tax=Skermania sp. ID1734 TaxID=2597516 RepID=UPI00117D3160|nr:MCE family protein [Skermania sp. ID1734]TSE00300.1 MCE family protein [Skermania sp. ID1734]
MSIKKPLIGFTLFAIVSILVTWVVWSTLERSVEGGTNDYSATFSNVLGLKNGDDVRIAGVRVGRVQKVELDDKNNAKVDFVVQNDQHLYRNTQAQILYQNLIGQRFLALEPGKGGDSSPLPAGSSIPLSQTQPSFDVSALLGGLQPLFSVLQPDQINSLSATFIQALQGDGVSLSAFVTQAAALAETFGQRDVLIGDVIDNLNGVVNGLAKRSDDLDTLITQTRSLMSGLYAQGKLLENSTERVANAADALVDMMGKIKPTLKRAQDSTTQAIDLLVATGPALDQAALDLPRAGVDLSRVTGQGAYLNIYPCSLDISLWNVLFPRGLFSQIGGNSHTEVCR